MFQGRIDEAFGAEFIYDIHAKELVVGEIFVRIYNEQPTFPLVVRHIDIFDYYPMEFLFMHKSITFLMSLYSALIS